MYVDEFTLAESKINARVYSHNFDGARTRGFRIRMSVSAMQDPTEAEEETWLDDHNSKVAIEQPPRGGLTRPPCKG